MIELNIPPRPNLRPYRLSREFLRYPGRNHPEIGRWLAETYTRPGEWIVDPMVGVGQMWLSAPTDRPICASDPYADGHGLAAAPGRQVIFTRYRAEMIVPWPLLERTGRQRIGLVAFSPPYPQAHHAGATQHQIEMRDERSDWAIQGFSGPPPNMPQVYRNIAGWGYPTLAVVVRNRIHKGRETGWAGDNVTWIKAAGYHRVDWFCRSVHPTRWQQAKIARNPETPWIKREYVLVCHKEPHKCL